MESIAATGLLNSTAAPRSSAAFSDLGSQDFLKLMLTELTNQDPLAPTDNEALLRQISSIREIELSTSLSDTLQKLTGQQQIGSASSLIGQYVSSVPGATGESARGVVVGVRFGEGGQPVLMLSSGAQVPLNQLETVQSPLLAAQELIGRAIVGLDRRDPTDVRVVEGVVTGASVAEDGEAMLEMDGGAELRLRDVVNVVSGEA